jgi:hypothetical protein
VTVFEERFLHPASLTPQRYDFFYVYSRIGEDFFPLALSAQPMGDFALLLLNNYKDGNVIDKKCQKGFG